MPEQIAGDFYKDKDLDEKKKQSLVLTNIGDWVSIGDEGETSTGLVTLSKHGRQRIVGEFFLKSLYSRNASDERSATAILEKHKWLKEHGLPVVPTLRYNPEKNVLLMTDMTRGGEKVIIDKHVGLEESGISPDEIRNYKELKRRILGIAKKAYAGGNGIFLDSDAYAVFIDAQPGKDGLRGAEVGLVDIAALTKKLVEIPRDSRAYFSEGEALARAGGFYNECLTIETRN